MEIIGTDGSASRSSSIDIIIRESQTLGYVLVDASRDGGAWWSPQGEKGDYKQPHQGETLANYLRAIGYSVTVTCPH